MTSRRRRPHYRPAAVGYRALRWKARLPRRAAAAAAAATSPRVSASAGRPATVAAARAAQASASCRPDCRGRLRAAHHHATVATTTAAHPPAAGQPIDRRNHPVGIIRSAAAGPAADTIRPSCGKPELPSHQMPRAASPHTSEGYASAVRVCRRSWRFASTTRRTAASQPMRDAILIEALPFLATDDTTVSH